MTSEGTAFSTAAVPGSYDVIAACAGFPYGLAEAVRLLQEVKRPVLVVCADTPLLTRDTLHEVVRVHRENGARGTLLVAELDDPAGYGRVVLDSDGGVLRIVEQKDADEPTRRDIAERLHLEAAPLFAAGYDRPNLFYRIVPKRSPRDDLLRFIEDEHPADAGIVYCMTRRAVEETAAFLTRTG